MRRTKFSKVLHSHIKMFKKQITAAAALILFLTFVGRAQEWRPVSGSRQMNISGMALVSHEKGRSSFLIAHDNKKKEQTHAAILSVNGSEAPIYVPLKWLGVDVPVDIEAATVVPGFPGQFILFTAAGRVFQVKLDAAAAQLTLIRSYDVPAIPADADFEGFDVQVIDETLIAVWSDRGETEKPATLFWGKLDLADGSISNVRSAKLKVPFPETNVRHISDIKVDPTGGVFITSASDPGNDGPFSSAMYFGGVISKAADKSFIFAHPTAFTPLFRFPYRKIEAFEFVPGIAGGIAFGTDDENLGSSILLTF